MQQDVGANAPATVVAEMDGVAMSGLGSQDHAPCPASTVVVVVLQAPVHEGGEDVEMGASQVVCLATGGARLRGASQIGWLCMESRGWQGQLSLNLGGAQIWPGEGCRRVREGRGRQSIVLVGRWRGGVAVIMVVMVVLVVM